MLFWGELLDQLSAEADDGLSWGRISTIEANRDNDTAA